jgi:hypothetical protein
LPPAPAPTPPPDPTDPLSAELERQRRELAKAQSALLAQLTDWERQRGAAAQAAGELAALAEKRRGLADRRAEAERAAAGHGQAARSVVLSLDEVRERSRKLLAQIEDLKKAPTNKQLLRYRTPVSHPLQTEELIFECLGGKVSVVDVGGLVEQAQRDARGRLDELRGSWSFRGETGSLGVFKLAYEVERERGALDGVGGVPIQKGGFQAHMTYWEVVPTAAERGETADAALADGSAFRRVVDALEPEQTAVTFWVYPDSFPLYRRLRDFLHDRDVTVAGRPLPDGHPIAFSTRHGSVSRGQ